MAETILDEIQRAIGAETRRGKVNGRDIRIRLTSAGLAEVIKDAERMKTPFDPKKGTLFGVPYEISPLPTNEWSVYVA